MFILGAIITVAVVLIVIATAFPIVWPMVVTSGYNITGDVAANVTGMTGTDAGTTTVQGFWPLILLMVGIGIAIGLIVYAIRQFKILKGG